MLRSCIHLFNDARLRLLMFLLLALLADILNFIMQYISAWVVCGVGIILRSTYGTFDKVGVGRDGVLLNAVAACGPMGFVFDGFLEQYRARMVRLAKGSVSGRGGAPGIKVPPGQISGRVLREGPDLYHACLSGTPASPRRFLAGTRAYG
eukprot:CAMPEP_0194346690 /NCGR_PEP_ID=MMETSP0171-20130528/105570_1 /TAXON_ID=218684 /ORGANISM="Corethron pennatum, Strain L29A3" /LENGTH=149 /DNA_ID=CAMNT_0039113851 /DNA_START=336 /DNA_END=786 /DNA_ORIENTATION=-